MCQLNLQRDELMSKFPKHGHYLVIDTWHLVFHIDSDSFHLNHFELDKGFPL